jgi:hypothetical protein
MCSFAQGEKWYVRSFMFYFFFEHELLDFEVCYAVFIFKCAMLCFVLKCAMLCLFWSVLCCVLFSSVLCCVYFEVCYVVFVGKAAKGFDFPT